MASLELDPRTTALVLIDLQQGIVAGQTLPHTAADVVGRAARLVGRFRERGALVVLVDAMAAREADLHTFPVTRVFPSIGQVCSTGDVLAALA